MIIISHSGSFNNTENFFKRSVSREYLLALEKYGREGVAALASATPVDTGETANSWDYNVVMTSGGFKIEWGNSHVESGIPIAVLIQYGHGTRNGGYVQGRDFINPVIQPIFDKIADEIWKEVTK
jgi:hypothetical protein